MVRKNKNLSNRPVLTGAAVWQSNIIYHKKESRVRDG